MGSPVACRYGDTRKAQSTVSDAAAGHVTHHGGCHCGRVRFAVQAPAAIQALDCNCSICRMGGFLHLIVPARHFTLVHGEADLVDYRFGTGTARHRFCAHCGIKSFYVPRSHPDGIDVNVRCLDAGSVASLVVSAFDDARREESTAAITHLSRI